MEIERRFIVYLDILTGLESSHHVLIVKTGVKSVLLSHPNLFLHENANRSMHTSNRYSLLISMFYRFLSRESKYKGIDVSQFDVIADNNDIKRWQVCRQEERLRKQSAKPSSATIYDDAKFILYYFSWLSHAGFVTTVNVKSKTWVATVKSDRLLNYTRPQERTAIDHRNIEVLDQEHRQARLQYLITNQEIKLLLGSYRDAVYVAMFKMGLGTAMRPMDLVKFPYIGRGSNKHILPYSDMDILASKVVDYTVENSKGGKTRKIKINVADLKALEDGYLSQCYHERARLYAKRYGKKCPPSVLFLNRFGVPVTPKMISDATTFAKKRAIEIFPNFREGVNFYEARHWWPTMFLIRFFGDRLLSESADALYAAAAEVLKNQMGHEDIATTYRFYIDKARLVAMGSRGFVNEIIASPGMNVESFIDEIEAQAGALIGA
ncbi:site-specific integrase [Pseudomonas sp. OIL-1]|uniref:site-specific integrase n=1 Tax=Pseudomonas sp. OIL-1 TaxID=2706126 RepID=UPI001C49B18A|nr:site-specific integrase [Pseudomonas sp. OIL-1]